MCQLIVTESEIFSLATVLGGSTVITWALSTHFDISFKDTVLFFLQYELKSHSGRHKPQAVSYTPTVPCHCMCAGVYYSRVTR